MDISSPYIIGALAGLLLFLVLYTLFVPKGEARPIENNLEAADNKLLKFVGTIGSDFYSSLPAGLIKAQKRKTTNPRIESLIVRSGNPWKLKADEFVLVQYIGGFLGFLASWLVWLFLLLFISVPFWIVVPAVTIFSFMIPRIKYNEQAKKRDLEFKRQLPEALDLLIISLSGGRTFAQSLRDIIPNMQDGILKDEFQTIISNMNVGKTLQESLNEFALRVPSESITTFVRAVQSSTEVDSPIIDILKSRAEESRQEFFAMIHEKTAQLESKIFMLITPTLLPAILLVAVAPSIASMLQTLGS